MTTGGLGMARLVAMAYCPSSSRRKGPQNIFVYILLALFDFLFLFIFINPELLFYEVINFVED